MPPLVLVVEPDHRQATVIRHLVKERLKGELVLAESKDGALAALGERVPDVVLLSALLSPRDESELADHLRSLDDAEHVQTLTIPVFATGSIPDDDPQPKRRGLFGKFSKKEKRAPEAPSGCEPSVFGDELVTYAERARELHAERAARLEREAHQERITRASQAAWAEVAPPSPDVVAGTEAHALPAHHSDVEPTVPEDEAPYVEPEPIVRADPFPPVVERVVEPTPQRRGSMWLDRATTITPRPELDTPFISAIRAASKPREDFHLGDYNGEATDEPEVAQPDEVDTDVTPVDDMQTAPAEEVDADSPVVAMDPSSTDYVADAYASPSYSSESYASDSYASDYHTGDSHTSDSSLDDSHTNDSPAYASEPYAPAVEEPQDAQAHIETPAPIAFEPPAYTETPAPVSYEPPAYASEPAPVAEEAAVIDLSSALDVDEGSGAAVADEPEIVLTSSTLDSLSDFQSSSEVEAVAQAASPDPDRIEMPSLGVSDFEREFARFTPIEPVPYVPPAAAEPVYEPAVDSYEALRDLFPVTESPVGEAPDFDVPVASEAAVDYSTSFSATDASIETPAADAEPSRFGVEFHDAPAAVSESARASVPEPASDLSTPHEGMPGSILFSSFSRSSSRHVEDDSTSHADPESSMDARTDEEPVAPKKTKSPVAAARMLIAAAARSLRAKKVEPPPEPEAAPAPPPTPSPAEIPALTMDARWITGAIDALRTDIQLLREERERQTKASADAAVATAAAATAAAAAAAAAAAVPAQGAAPARPEKRRKKVVKKKKKKLAAPRPVQDEWGLYDPNQCGFEALLAEVESRQQEEEVEDEPEPAELLLQQPAAADLTPKAPSRKAPPLHMVPLAMWARAEGTAEPAVPVAPARSDDLLALIEGLRLPAPVASVRYASGCRIRKIRIAADPNADAEAEDPVVILSKKTLRNISGKPPRNASA